MKISGLSLASQPIRAITFDLDDTLFDFQACMTRCAEMVLRELCQRHPGAAETATLERFHACWQDATEEAQARGGVLDWPAVRRRGIALLLTECDRAGGDALADELTALYFRHRHAPTPPFADAAAAIPLLAQRLPLGIISNANTRLAALGLDPYFRTVVTPTVAGCGKPDPAIFHHAAAALGCAPAALLHVGDRWEDDVAGAHQAGCQAVWYCRTAQAAPDPSLPHRVVSDHRELIAWLPAAPAG
jgi:FMN hydrolase / 5-amino-6-(5-phospho-D-ribitylamino)uracil phosphatase